MSWYLGVDAGGSYTRAAILDLETGVGGEGHAGPGNPFTVPSDSAFDAIEQAVAGALGEVGCHPHEMSGACLGVAGLARQELPAGWLERFTDWRIDDLAVVSDLEIAHYAVFQGRPGIQVIAGTGSSVLVRDRTGEGRVYGGWGWLLGDEGSALDLGRAAFNRAAALADSGGEPDPLTRTLLDALKVDSVWAALPRVYQAERPHQVLAHLAPGVTALAASGDEAAAAVVEQSARRLAAVVEVAARRLEEGEGAQVAVSGSVFRADAFVHAFEKALKEAPRPLSVRRSPWSPLAGAVLRASGQQTVEAGSPLDKKLLSL